MMRRSAVTNLQNTAKPGRHERNYSFSICLRYDPSREGSGPDSQIGIHRVGLRATRGSHRQFKHPQKPFVVTVAGHSGKDVPIGTLRAILKAAGLEGDEQR